MKKILTLTILFVISSFQAFSLGPLKFGIQAGLSTPSKQFADVYNKDNVTYILNPSSPNQEEVAGNLVKNGVDAGYHIGANIRISLSEKFSLTGGFMYNSLNEARMNLNNPETGDSIATFISSQRVVPVSGGLMYHFLELGFVEFYLRADAQINYIAYETKFEYAINDIQVAIPISSSASYARIGYSFGGGIDFDLELIRLNLDARYNLANFVGRANDEEAKSYFTLGLGIFF